MRKPIDLPPAQQRTAADLKPHQRRALTCYEEWRFWYDGQTATAKSGDYHAQLRATFIAKYAAETGFAKRTIRDYFAQGKRLWAIGYRSN